MFNSVRFKELLDNQHEWPGHYTFKFVCTQSQVSELSTLFVGQNILLRESSKGKYISVSVSMELASSDAVVEIYRKAAARVPGLIAL